MTQHLLHDANELHEAAIARMRTQHADELARVNAELAEAQASLARITAINEDNHAKLQTWVNEAGPKISALEAELAETQEALCWFHDRRFTLTSKFGLYGPPDFAAALQAHCLKIAALLKEKEGGVMDDDLHDEDCWNCGGEGFTYGCDWDWQCPTYDEGEMSCLCTRRCEWCTPLISDAQMKKVLGDTIKDAESVCASCHGTGTLYRQDCGAHGLTKPCPNCATPTNPKGDD